MKENKKKKVFDTKETLRSVLGKYEKLFEKNQGIGRTAFFIVKKFCYKTFSL